MNKKILLLIIFIAFILRFYKLGEIPLGLNWDEVSNAYNAYSILKTGRDEYGNLLPLTNRSFDDYKPPLYMYLAVPSVALFDLTPFAARLPSAFFGTLTVLLIYFFSKKLFEKSVLPFTINNPPFTVAHLTALLLAVSPWHLQVSRAGFEANIGLFFSVAAFTTLLYSLLNQNHPRTKNLLFIVSAILFGLTVYTYHSQRIFMPLMIIATFLIFKKEFLQMPKKLVITAVITILILVLPAVFLVPQEAIVKRLQATSFQPRQLDIDRAANLIDDDNQENFPLANILHNRRIIFAQTYFKNYLSHFDLNFLFVKGDYNLRHHIEGMGMFYIFQLPLILIGIYLSILNENTPAFMPGMKAASSEEKRTLASRLGESIKRRSKQSMFLLSWLLLSPIPSIAGDANPHAVRSLTMIVPLTIFSAVGFTQIYNYLSFKKFFLTPAFSLPTIATTVAGLIIFHLSLFTYLHNYLRHYPNQSSSSWQYEYLQAVNKTEDLKSQYSKINIGPNIEQAYIFWLFYLKYDPTLYQKSGSKLNFDKFYFNENEPEYPNELYVNSYLPERFDIVDTIYNLNGEKTIEIGLLK